MDKVSTREQERYLVGPQVWTHEIQRAKDFTSLLPALDYQERYKLANVEAFFSFDEPKYNFAIKIGQ